MDNYFHDCPPMMDDGRFLTDYSTPTRRNEYIKYINEIVRNDDYRKLLQCNGKTFIEREWENQRRQNSCWKNACVHNYPTRTLPHFFSKELNDYNNIHNLVKTGDLRCEQFDDYRLFPQGESMICDEPVNNGLNNEKKFENNDIFRREKAQKYCAENKLD